MLGAAYVIATQMRHADGRYTGEMEFYAYEEYKAAREPGPAASQGRYGARLARPRVRGDERHPWRPSRPDPRPVSGSNEPVRHVNSSFNKDHESITTSSSQVRGSVVEMRHGLLVLTRQPGTHARPAAGGGRGRSIQRTDRPQAIGTDALPGSEGARLVTRT